MDEVRSNVQNGTEPVYQLLARRLEGMINGRSLRPGDRMPSLRKFSAEQRVSVPTALHAYSLLETRGLIEARPKSGFYVIPRQAALTPAPSRPAQQTRITDFANTDLFASLLADAENPNLVPLGAAVPSAEMLPGARLVRTMAAVGRKLKHAGVNYDMPPGAEVLRRELARRSLQYGCALPADAFVVTAGASEAVALALRVTCAPGDTVIVESPTYYGHARLLRELRLRALPIAVDSTRGIDLEILERALRRTRVAACLLIPNFHNPAGFVMPDACKRQVVDLLAAKAVPLIEDDIYGDLPHAGVRPRCLKAFDAGEGVILCSSFSKTLAPGYRVGYIAAGRWHPQVLALKRVTTLGCATLPVLAVAEFLRNGGYDRYLRSIREAYRRQVERMRQAIVDSMPALTGLSHPKGGYLLWCELPAGIDSLDLAARARKAGITIAPGPMFSPDGCFRNFIRINCGFPWSSRIERAVGVLGHLVRPLSR